MFLFFIYQIISCIVSITLIPIFYLHPRGKIRLSERLGFWNLSGKFTWFHAASAGEVKGILAIINEYVKFHPNEKILLTAISVNGLNIVKDANLILRILPFDNLLYVSNALRNVIIEKFIVSETEIWPTVLAYLQNRNVPCYYVNAIISKFTINRYLLTKRFISNFLNKFKFIACVNEAAKNNFLKLGVAPKLIEVTGNSKYQTMPKVIDSSKFITTKKHTITLGSIRPGEEKHWLPFIKKFSEIFWIIAPRHKESLPYFEQQLKKHTINYCLRSVNNNYHDKEALLVDTFGELELFYSCSNLAFIGATFIPKIGGHNPLEPAMYGVVPAVGPYYDKISDIVELLKLDNAIIKLNSTSDVERTIDLLVHEPGSIKKMGLSAKKVWENFSGIAEKIVEKINNA